VANPFHPAQSCSCSPASSHRIAWWRRCSAPFMRVTTFRGPHVPRRSKLPMNSFMKWN